MIVHVLHPKQGLAILTPEELDDLWVLRRIIHRGDLVSSETSRVVKSQGEFIRPDKGERIKVFLTIEVESVKMDSTLERLRVSGKITDASSDLLSKGSLHSLIVSPDRKLFLRKDKWSDFQINLVKESGKSRDSFIIVSIDRREAGIGIVKGTRLKILPTIDSGYSGKFYTETKKPADFFEAVVSSIKASFRSGMKVFVLGPGTTKNAFANYVAQNDKQIALSLSVIDGLDVSGEDGVFLSLRSDNLKRALVETKLAKISSTLAEIVSRIGRNDDRVAIGYDECRDAANVGAISSMLISEKVFEGTAGESYIVDLLNSVESNGGETYMLDSSTDVGTQVSKLGGLVALLRYKVF
jgi:protein pelota